MGLATFPPMKGMNTYLAAALPTKASPEQDPVMSEWVFALLGTVALVSLATITITVVVIGKLVV
jgi:hypothetical protein